MAHAQRLTEQVKTMSARIKQLEAALADAQIGPLPLAALGDEQAVSRRSSQDGELIDVKREGDMDNMSKGLGSLAIDGEGKAQYYGETAGAEVRFRPPFFFSSSYSCLVFRKSQYLQHLMPVVCYQLFSLARFVLSTFSGRKSKLETHAQSRNQRT